MSATRTMTATGGGFSRSTARSTCGSAMTTSRARRPRTERGSSAVIFKPIAGPSGRLGTEQPTPKVTLEAFARAASRGSSDPLEEMVRRPIEAIIRSSRRICPRRPADRPELSPCAVRRYENDFMGTGAARDRVDHPRGHLDRVARRARLELRHRVRRRGHRGDRDDDGDRTNSRVRASRRFRCRTSARRPT